MTGFGRSETVDTRTKITVEIKSVNHRYCDINVKLPKRFNLFEAQIRNYLKQQIGRGKVDVYLSCEEINDNRVYVKYNKEIAAEYLEQIKTMSSDFSIENDVTTSIMSRLPEVLTLEEQSIEEESLWPAIETALTKATEAFIESRVVEGNHLKEDLLCKLDEMTNYIEYIEGFLPELMKNYRTKLEEKVAELLGGTDIDEHRILTEVTLYADKTGVDEELVRLGSHIERTKETLLEGGAAGRKLDFLAQEMNREANTILSKSADISVSNKAIDLKTEIEKVREQIQNIE